MRLMHKVDGMTVDEQRHTVRQKSMGIEGRCVDHWTDWLVGHADQNYCENQLSANYRAIERNTGF